MLILLSDVSLLFVGGWLLFHDLPWCATVVLASLVAQIAGRMSRTKYLIRRLQDVRKILRDDHNGSRP